MYYFISYAIKKGSSTYDLENMGLKDEHPIKWIKKVNDKESKKFILLNFDKINEELYYDLKNID